MSTNGDKRSVSTDALESLGTIIGAGEARDAIHLAVEPVMAGQRLLPGQDIGLVDGKAFTAKNCPKALGIVDPFIVGQVEEGERFWLVVYPRQIKSLRHVWEHPDFARSHDAPSQDVFVVPAGSGVSNDPHRGWIVAYCQRIGCTYDEIMDAAEAYQLGGRYWVQGGRWEGTYLDEDFWVHWAAITGKTVDDTGSFFSCSC